MTDSVKCLGFAELLKQAKTTDQIHDLWEKYAKQGISEVPQKIMELMEGQWVSVDVLKKCEQDNVIVPRKQLQDFLYHNDRNVLEMFCQQGPPTKHWIETQGQYWQGWQDCNRKVKEFFGKAFSSSDSLSPEENRDVEASEKELAIGKCKKFENATDLIADLHKPAKEHLSRNRIWELTEAELIRHKQAYPTRLITFDEVHAIVGKVFDETFSQKGSLQEKKECVSK